jgi:hypothetical protein
MAQGLSGKLFGGRGYISQKLFESLRAQGVELITKLRKNMKSTACPHRQDPPEKEGLD